MYQNLIKPFAKDAYKFILDTLFPVYCLVCEKEEFTQHLDLTKNENSEQDNDISQKEGLKTKSKKENAGFICQNCRIKFKKLEQQHCIMCQFPSIGGLTHPKCKTPFAPEGLVSIFDYHDKKLSNVIIKGKYKFLPQVYEILGEMIIKNLMTDYPNLLNLISCNLNLLLIPIPLHKRRKLWRGFNQAEILAQSLANSFNKTNASSRITACIKIQVDIILTRCKPTKTQKDLKKQERFDNIKNAFRLNEGVDIHKKNIILIDDVTTTGSTLLEAVKVLKRNGARQIFCLTIARD